MLTKEQKEQFTEIFDELSENLDISEIQFDAAVRSYKAVGTWLAGDDSLLNPYNPTIQPQGSIIIGTIIKPIHKDDDVDIDLVCELSGKDPKWTQKHLKEIVRDQLMKHKKYESILDDEGRRCWTLKYREGSPLDDKYHMDILPSIITNGYKLVVEKKFSHVGLDEVEQLAISITDNKLTNYDKETNIEYWLKSNPFGYAKWFIDKATIKSTKLFSLNEAVKPVPKYQKDRFPLQRVVQILKRHRDIMFKGDDEKPISIIITTLAGYGYNKETNLFDALVNVINRMHLFIENKYDYEKGESYLFIGNPVNKEENFADKWRENKNKQVKFYSWLTQIRNDIESLTFKRGIRIQESLTKSFGENEVTKTFSNIGNRRKLLTEQGNSRFNTKNGISVGAANIVKPHTFYGSED